MLEPMDVQQAVGEVQVKAKPNDNAEAIKIEVDKKQTDGKMTDSEIAALNNKLANLLARPPFCSPKLIKRNVKALKKIQRERLKLEVDYHKEVFELEMKYEKIYKPLFEKRRQIVNGITIPTDEECDYHSDSEKEIDLFGEMQNVDDAEVKTEKPESSTKGIPGFWLTVLKHAPFVTDAIEECDEPILHHLIDVTVTSSIDPMITVIEFHFEPNDYFSNSILTLSYEYECTPPDTLKRFGFRGPKIINCKGCTIDWKEGKNVTLQTMEMKRSDGTVKIVQNESFFNFFCPPTVPKGKEKEVDKDTRAIIKDIFTVGKFIKMQIIGYAVLFFAKHKKVEDEFDDEEEEEDDDDELFKDNFCDEDVERKR